ncbi:MAG: AraC family transcriptional regulator [Treponema sp.]|jgi:AraC family transcriptional regulator|nr:AraC family transcriptional regulator [Treponema sp.]
MIKYDKEGSNLEHIDILQEMLRYIDAHIKEEMNVEKLAERAGFSPYYFCRIFQCGVGSSIMEYVRSRRLAYAASELNSGRKILNIAIDYGFETHSGFSKAFHRYFGCPPEIYRAYATFDVPKIPDLSKTNQFISEFVIEPKIMAKKAPFKLAGFAFNIKLPSNTSLTGNGHIYHKNFEKFPKLWEECRTDGRLEKLHHESFLKFHAEYGACFFKDYEEGKFVYFIGVEAKSRVTIPFCYDVYTIPEALFAVFTTPSSNENNFSSIIKNTWRIIFSEWLPNSGYELDGNGVAFELYDDRSTVDTGKVCNICIPIVKRQL